MEPGDKKALEDIEKYGCHILHILEEGDLSRFSCSIGIRQQTGQPELIVTASSGIWHSGSSMSTTAASVPERSSTHPPADYTWFLPRLYAQQQ